MQTYTSETLPGADFVSWISHDWNPTTMEGTAVGTLHGGRVTASGSFEGTWYQDDGPFLDPLIGWPFLPHIWPSHVLDLSIPRGDQAEPLENHFKLSFGVAVKDPIIHLASFGSTLVFPDVPAVSKLNGQDRFVVAGNVVMGDIVREEETPTFSLNDMNGSIRLVGTFDTIEFIGKYHLPVGNHDGVYFQVGGWGSP